MPESTKNNSLVNEYGQVEDQDLARKMADTEKEVRNTFGKEEEDKSEVDKWVNEESEGVFREETGKEYSDAVKEAQEGAVYEINAVENSVKGETKKDVEIIEQKPGAEGKDNSDAKKAVKNYQDVIQDAKTDSETKIAPVVSKVETKETNQDRLNKVKKEVEKRVIEIQEIIDILDGKKGGRGEVLTYLKKAAGIEGRNLTVEEEKIYWDREMYRLKAEKQGYEVVNLFFENNNSPADWEKFQKHLRFSLKSEKNLVDEYIDKIDKDPAFSNQNKSIGLLKEEAMRDSETIQGIFLGLMDKNAQPKDSSESGSDIGEINPELRANQERIRNELRSVEYAWSVFKSGKGEEFDALINQQAEDLGITDKPKETIEGLVRSRLENSRAALKEVRSILNKSNSIEEFNQEIQNYLDLTHKFEKKELDEASLIVDTKKRGKKERKIKNKHRFAGEVLMQYLPPKKDGSKPADKPDASVEAQSPTEGDTQKPSKNPTEQENDEAESKLKTNGPVYGKESIPEDAQEEAERIKNGKKAEGKKEEPASAEVTASKEKTAEEILREKNIELYGGPEKFNKIIEAYQKLNELVDKKANVVDDKGKPLNEKLFKEWDALRVDLAGSKIVIMDEKMGIKSVHGEYEIKNPEEKIRKFYDKLNEPVEAFAADSAEDTIIRAATLVKHRNELAERLSHAKNANLEAQIRDLDKKIEVLNKKTGERRDPSKPEIPLSDLLISDFEKAGDKEAAEEKLNKEADEIKSELKNTPKEERRKIGLGIRTFGFFLQEQKSKSIGWLCKKLSNIASKASGEELDDTGKVKSIETAGTMTRFLASLAETYRRDETRARQSIDQDPASLEQLAWRQMQNAGYLSGNILKYGRTVADVAGWTAGSPLRYFMMGSQVFARGAEAAKEARLKNAEVIDKTRLDYDEAVDEAYKIYEQAKESATQREFGKVTVGEIEQAYLEQLPQDILDRLKKAEPGAATGIVERIGQKAFQKYIELSLKVGKFTKIGFQKRLKEYDAIVSKYGTVDALAMSAKLAETAGKTAVAAVSVETAYLALRNLPAIFENIGNAGGKPTGSGHGVFSGWKESLFGKHIPPQERSISDGDMAGYESGKGPEMFPGEKYFGVEANPEKVKNLIDQFNKDFRYHPEWKGSTLEQAKALDGLRQQLETAGIKDPDALKEIINSAKNQLNGDENVFIVKGGFQEAQNLAGIESTGGSGGDSTAEQTVTAAGAGKSVDAVVGAKTEATQLVNKIENTDGIKHDSIWRSTHELIQSKAKELGLEYPGAGKTKLTETEWYNAKTAQLVNELDKSTPGGIKDLVHEGDKIALTKGGDGKFHLSVEESSGIKSGRLADLHHHVAGAKAPAIENASSVPEFAPIHPEPIWEPMINQPQATDHLWDNRPKQAAGNRLNEIFDYPFGRQGAETITYQNVKNEIAENFLRRNLSREVDINDPFAIDSDDARRYGELQNYLNDMAKKPGNYPRTGETVDQFIHRLNRDIVATPEHAVPDAAPGETAPMPEAQNKIEIDKIDEDFFKEKSAVEEVFKVPEVITAAKPIHLSHDNFSADIQFKYNQSGEPISVDWIDAKIDGVRGSEYYEANYLKTIAKGFKEAGFTLENEARESASKAGRHLMELIKIHDELIIQGEKQEAAVLLDHIKDEIGIINTRYGHEIINSEKLPQEIREKLGK